MTDWLVAIGMFHPMSDRWEILHGGYRAYAWRSPRRHGTLCPYWKTVPVLQHTLLALALSLLALLSARTLSAYGLSQCPRRQDFAD